MWFTADLFWFYIWFLVWSSSVNHSLRAASHLYPDPLQPLALFFFFSLQIFENQQIVLFKLFLKILLLLPKTPQTLSLDPFFSEVIIWF